MDLLTHYLTTQQHSFEQNLPLINDPLEAEAVHDVRVSIKKIRSLFLLLKFVSQENFNYKKSYSEFKPLFKKLGFLRDVQVQSILLISYEGELEVKLSDYSAFLEKLNGKEREKIKKWLPSNIPPDWDYLYILINNIVDFSVPGFIIHKSNMFIENKLDEIRELLPAHENKTLHKIRRLLKEIRYIIDCLTGFSGENIFNPVMHINIKLIEDDLGNWHDRVVSAQLLERFYSKTKNENLRSDPAYIRLNDLIRRENLIFLDQGKQKLENVLFHKSIT